MKALLDILNMLPNSVKYGAIIGLLVVGVAYGHEARYMTVGQYTKSYVLDLRAEIRSIRIDLDNPELSVEVKRMLREQLEVMLDELCYEVPEDPYCKDR